VLNEKIVKKFKKLTLESEEKKVEEKTQEGGKPAIKYS